MICSYKEIIDHITTWKNRQQKIVLVTGAFDIIHQEHVNFLEKAKQEGDMLIVGLESDKRVTKLKGSGRPVNTIAIRLHQIETCADSCFELPDVEDWLQFMQELKPDSYCVSSESPFMENKQLVCQQARVELKIVHQHNPAVSTTQLLKKSVQ